jgi:hypothetical protein
LLPRKKTKHPAKNHACRKPPDRATAARRTADRKPPAAKPQSVLSEEPAAVSEDPVVFAAWPEVVELLNP